MARTLQEQLDSCDAAIQRAEEAQAYEIGGRSKTNANLAVLYKRRDELARMLADSSDGGSMASLGFQVPPT